MSEKFVRVGKVKDAHGIRGELFVVFFAGEADWMDELETLRLVRETGGVEPQTFSIKSVRAHKNGMIVKSSDIKDRNQAETLKGLIVEIPEEFLTSEPGEQIYLREILGFGVVTQAQGEVGQIESFSSNVAQDLLVVKTAHGTFEIPFVEAFVEKIDYEGQKIFMDLPIGLLGEDVGPSKQDDGRNDSQADQPDTGAEEDIDTDDDIDDEQ